MKSVKFKELPEKVQTFLYENQHSLGYFCPENDIQLNWLHNISIWDKATDKERLAYAEWRYKFGVRLKDAYDDEEYDLKLRDTIFYLEKDPRSPHDILLTRHSHDTDITIYESDKNKWAEIIEKPEKEEKIIFSSNDISDSDKKEIERMIKESKNTPSNLEPTFKAGEYVEGIYAGEGSYGEFWFTGGKTKDEGRFICEDKHGGLLFFTEIRKIDPDKTYREIAKEMIGNARVHEFTSIEYITVESAESMLIEALKKGKRL